MRAPAPRNEGRSEHTEALYLEHGAAVAALCRSLLRGHAEFEDATQQVFLSAHRALLNGAVPREPLAWLLTIARHECYERFRQRAAAPVPTGDAPERATGDVSVNVLRAGELASLWDEVGRMPRTQREAFLLREIQGLSYGQLAAELSVSPPSVRSLLVRARARLRHRLRDVAAAVGAAPWVQALPRFVAGGDGTSPLPAATKAIAVGLGALALTSAGDVPRLGHRAPTAPGDAATHHRPDAHAPRAAVPPPVSGAAERGNGGTRDLASGPANRSDARGGGTASDRSGSRRGSDRGESSSSSAGDGSGGGTGSGEAATPTPVQTGSSDGVTTGTSGSDGGSDSVTSTTSSGSGSDGASPDGGSDGGASSTDGG